MSKPRPVVTQRVVEPVETTPSSTEAKDVLVSAGWTRQAAAMPYVYILECADGSNYVGSTTDIDVRLQEHNSGRGAAYTRRRLPVQLAWAEHYDSVAEAFAMEKRLQDWRRAKREAVIRGELHLLPELSRHRADNS